MFGLNDPSALLRPWRNLQQFSEELYAMFSKGESVAGLPATEKAAKPTTESPARRTASEQARVELNATRKLRLEAARDRPASPVAPSRDSHATKTRTPQAGGQGVPRERPSVSPAVAHETPAPPVAAPARPKLPQAQRPQATPAPLPIRVRRAVPERKAKPYEPSRVFPAPEEYRDKRPARETEGFTNLDIGEFANQVGGAGGTTTFMGQVVSGSGNTYQVNLFRSGPGGAPDASPVTVKITTIDPGETIDPMTWLSPIFQFSDGSGDNTYSCQPPIWMA